MLSHLPSSLRPLIPFLPSARGSRRQARALQRLLFPLILRKRKTGRARENGSSGRRRHCVSLSHREYSANVRSHRPVLLLALTCVPRHVPRLSVHLFLPPPAALVFPLLFPSSPSPNSQPNPSIPSAEFQISLAQATSLFFFLAFQIRILKWRRGGRG